MGKKKKTETKKEKPVEKVIKPEVSIHTPEVVAEEVSVNEEVATSVEEEKSQAVVIIEEVLTRISSKIKVYATITQESGEKLYLIEFSGGYEIAEKKYKVPAGVKCAWVGEKFVNKIK